MAAHEALKELATQLSMASTGEDIGRALLRVGKRFGLENGTILDITKLFNRVGPALIFSSRGADFVEAFNLTRPLLHHPVTQLARQWERPFLLSELRNAMRRESEERAANLLPEEMKDLDGIIVPVHEEGELAWLVTFTGRDADLRQATQSVMSAAAHAGYSLFQKLIAHEVPQSPLSPRESECLGWVAEGKTDAEVGKILQISPRTVRFHINNAKTKLGVATRIQAVTKRMRAA
jgi:DNA-binding CsgD family transcriptional regulator